MEKKGRNWTVAGVCACVCVDRPMCVCYIVIFFIHIIFLLCCNFFSMGNEVRVLFVSCTMVNCYCHGQMEWLGGGARQLSDFHIKT